MAKQQTFFHLEQWDGEVPLAALPDPDEQTAGNYGICYDAYSFATVEVYGIACHAAAVKAAWNARQPEVDWLYHTVSALHHEIYELEQKLAAAAFWRDA